MTPAPRVASAPPSVPTQPGGLHLGTVPPSALTGPLPDLDGDHLAHVVAARFLIGHASTTRAAYRRDLLHYFEWCARHDVPVLDAARSTIDTYARDLAERPQGPRHRPMSRATVARRLSTLSGFYRYALSEDVITKSPVAHVRRPRMDSDSPTMGLDRSEAKALLAASRDHGPRATALIALLIHDGLRISEALGADVEDVTTVRGHRVLAITRKGGARRHVVLNGAVCDALDTYLIDRTSGPLFSTRTGGRYDRSDAWRLVRRIAADAGLEHADRLSPHSLRHTFVTLAREAGVPLEDVQDAAGHTDPRTTRRYDRGRHNLDRSPAHALGAFLAVTPSESSRDGD